MSHSEMFLIGGSCGMLLIGVVVYIVGGLC